MSASSSPSATEMSALASSATEMSALASSALASSATATAPSGKTSESEWSKSFLRKMLIYPYKIFPTRFSRAAVGIILILIFTVNTMVLNQRYTQSDADFDKISDNLYNTLLGFAIAIGLFAFAVIYNMGSNPAFGGFRGVLKAVFFVGLVIWALTPEIILLYSRPGCSVAHLETAVVANAWASVFLSGLGLVWFFAGLGLGYKDAKKLATNQKQPEPEPVVNKCQDLINNNSTAEYNLSSSCGNDDEFCYAQNDYVLNEGDVKNTNKELRYNLKDKQFEYWNHNSNEWRVCDPKDKPCRYGCEINAANPTGGSMTTKWRPEDLQHSAYMHPQSRNRCTTADGKYYTLVGNKWEENTP